MKFEVLKALPPDLQALAMEILSLRSCFERLDAQVGEVLKNVKILNEGLTELDATLEKELNDSPRVPEVTHP